MAEIEDLNQDSMGQDEEAAKLRAHVDKKEAMATLRGPAAYNTKSSFEPKYKKD